MREQENEIVDLNADEVAAVGGGKCSRPGSRIPIDCDPSGNRNQEEVGEEAGPLTTAFSKTAEIAGNGAKVSGAAAGVALTLPIPGSRAAAAGLGTFAGVSVIYSGLAQAGAALTDGQGVFNVCNNC